MQIRNLRDTPFNAILECFFQAFHNYYVDLPKDHAYYKERWRMANVNYGLSFGAFYHGKLVGFVLNAIDCRAGLLTAYNACTGVLPEFRGKKAVKSIYDHALPILKENEIERCTLEVITQNNRAIRAYSSVGFEITKHYKCFSGTLAHEPMEEYELRDVGFTTEVLTKLLNQNWYSWENHALTITKGNYRYFEIVFEGIVESYFVIAPKGGYVPQLEVLVDNPKAWNRLFSGLAQITDLIKINNVDKRLTDKIAHLQNAGLENHLDQFEMQLFL
ncbi:GNAT family N-acetyltransferase [Allomuricauda sp. CP2A]|jgi:ribosomal protein S18 acetylase RimI-like enzyme|uniref:GNAT family N-acetyltransferase n=1 Tax=Allomuricauda sp. CP2A TaxID=1848189 RepID=UPI00082D2668|nr:GNAT family N-acetyltransferase [Muricauda sp. CP2A]